MIISILCPDANVKAAREKSKQIEQFAEHTSLAIPVSASGEAPPSHWFCTFNASEEIWQQIKGMQEFSEVEIADPKSFLEARNLHTISVRKIVAARREAKKAAKQAEKETE